MNVKLTMSKVTCLCRWVDRTGGGRGVCSCGLRNEWCDSQMRPAKHCHVSLYTRLECKKTFDLEEHIEWPFIVPESLVMDKDIHRRCLYSPTDYT